MNSCILMAEIIQEPQLRYTPDNQTQIAEMLVEFTLGGANDQRETLKVVGWGNLAQEIHQQYHEGDRVIIEGRLSMNTIDRKPEGFKEKRAELVVQRIYGLGANMVQSVTADRPPQNPARSQPNSAPASSNVVPLSARDRNPSPATQTRSASTEWEPAGSPSRSAGSASGELDSTGESEGPDYDPIPF